MDVERRLQELLMSWTPSGMSPVESVNAVGFNPYSSRLRSFIVEVTTVDRKRHLILAKLGRKGELTRTGHDWGVRYEARAYARVLSVMPCYETPYLGSVDDGLEQWLFLRWLEDSTSVAKVPQPDGIRAAATWLGQFHRQGAQNIARRREAGLNRYSEGLVVAWGDRVRIAVLEAWGPAASERSARMMATAHKVQMLLGTAETVVHGDFYPPNVLVSGSAVTPVDWEWVGIGAGEIDLAALVEGWGATADVCIDDYRRARWPGGDDGRFWQRFEAARFYLAVRWLGGNPARLLSPQATMRFEVLSATARALESPTGES